MTSPEGGMHPMVGELAAEISKGSIWYILLGVALTIGGIVLIANPLVGGLALTMLVAIVLVIEGGVYLINALMAPKISPNSFWI